MYKCHLCPAQTKTRQGLAGHIRFRHAGKEGTSNIRPQHTKLGDLAEQMEEIKRGYSGLAQDMEDLKLLAFGIAKHIGLMDHPDWRSWMQATTLAEGLKLRGDEQ